MHESGQECLLHFVYLDMLHLVMAVLLYAHSIRLRCQNSTIGRHEHASNCCCTAHAGSRFSLQVETCSVSQQLCLVAPGGAGGSGLMLPITKRVTVTCDTGDGDEEPAAAAVAAAREEEEDEEDGGAAGRGPASAKAAAAAGLLTPAAHKVGGRATGALEGLRLPAGCCGRARVTCGGLLA